MKKIIKLLTCMAMLTMVLSLAACGGDDDSSNNNSSKSDNSSNDKTYMYDSIEEYVNSEEFQSSLESLMSSLEDSGMKMDITGKDNKLIYTYTYTSITVDDDSKEAMAEALESGLTEQSSQFTSLAASRND